MPQSRPLFYRAVAPSLLAFFARGWEILTFVATLDSSTSKSPPCLRKKRGDKAGATRAIVLTIEPKRVSANLVSSFDGRKPKEA